MVENRTIKYNGDDVTIGDVTRPTSEIVSIVTSGSEIRVTFRDGSSDTGGSIGDLFTLRDICPWAAVAI